MASCGRLAIGLPGASVLSPRNRRYQIRSAFVTYTGIAYRLPRVLRRLILNFEVEIEDAVTAFARALPAGARVLDAGAGEGQYRPHFTRHRYCGVDLAVGDAAWDYTTLDALADLTALPFRDASFD